MVTCSTDIQICSHCRHKNKVHRLDSYSEEGKGNLDGRRNSLVEFPMASFVEECTHCGYTAHSIKDEHPEVEDVITSIEYLRVITTSPENENGMLMLKAALFSLAAKKRNEAGKFFHWAAWAMDDANDHLRAMECRNKAIDLLYPKHTHQNIHNTKKPPDVLVLVDLLRRSRRWREAEEIVSNLFAHNNTIKMDRTIGAIAQMQFDASRENDRKCYEVEAALIGYYPVALLMAKYPQIK